MSDPIVGKRYKIMFTNGQCGYGTYIGPASLPWTTKAWAFRDGAGATMKIDPKELKDNGIEPCEEGGCGCEG